MDESEVLPPGQLLIAEAREGGRLTSESPGLPLPVPRPVRLRLELEWGTVGKEACRDGVPA